MKLEKIKVITEILAKIPEVKGIYLFGSYAKGIAKKESDIDICVIAENNIDDDIRTSILSSSWHNVDISIIWDLPAFIAFRVFKDGKELLNKDELFVQRVKKTIIKQYLDFKPLINKYTKRLVGVANV